MLNLLYLIPIGMTLLGSWFMTVASGVRRCASPGYTLETLGILFILIACGLFGALLVFLP